MTGGPHDGPAADDAADTGRNATGLPRVADDAGPGHGAGVSRRRWLTGGVAVAALAAGAGIAWWRGRVAGGGGEDATALYDLSFPAPSGEPVPMRQFAGRPLLLNFWATWCPPCVEELPLLDAFYRQHAANGWQVVGLAADQAAAVSRFLERAPVAFPVALAGMAGIELSRSFGNTSGGLPFTVVLSADGRITARKIGRVSPEDLLAWSSPG